MKGYNFKDIACKIPVKTDNNWYMTPLLEFCKGIEDEFNVKCRFCLSSRNNLVTKYIIKIFAINNPIINESIFEITFTEDKDELYVNEENCKNEKQLYETLEVLIKNRAIIIEKIESYGL